MSSSFVSDFAPLQVLQDPAIEQAGIELSVLRLDQLFPEFSGNKYFKLKYNIEHAKAKGYRRLLSFGGAYSNHIHALAMAGKQFDLGTIGIIRGETANANNETLSDASAAGMSLHFVTRQQYRQRNDPDYLSVLQQTFDDAWIIPEGGSNLLGVKGCMEIVDHIKHHLGNDFDRVVVPCGTAATLAGIAASLDKDKVVVGIPVLKGASFLDADVKAYIQALALPVGDNWRLIHDFHCGGYAKVSAELVAFMDDFQARFELPMEPVYSAKLFYGLNQLLLQPNSVIEPGMKVVAIHTGGMQGLRGMAAKLDTLRCRSSH